MIKPPSDGTGTANKPAPTALSVSTNLRRLSQVSPRGDAGDLAIAHALGPELIVSVLRDHMAEPEVVIGALRVALLLVHEVSDGCKAELRQATFALRFDSRKIEFDPREGIPPILLSDEVENCCSRWPSW